MSYDFTFRQSSASKTSKMIPTPSCNTISKAMGHFEHTSHPSLPPEIHQHQESCAPLSLRLLDIAPHSTASGLGRLSVLPPEIRNTIYTLLLAPPGPIFIVPSPGRNRRFQLREWTDTSQYEALDALRALTLTSRQARWEARTLFYASKHCLVLAYGFEYLPVFVRWLEAIGAECRTVLRNISLTGYMWYQPAARLTSRLHALIRDCGLLRVLTVQLHIRHLGETCAADLDAYFEYTGPQQHDGPLPQIEISAWAGTIVRLPDLDCFRLYLVMAVDKKKVRLGQERSFR
jgi:hypothetical protein